MSSEEAMATDTAPMVAAEDVHSDSAGRKTLEEQMWDAEDGISSGEGSTARDCVGAARGARHDFGRRWTAPRQMGN